MSNFIKYIQRNKTLTTIAIVLLLTISLSTATMPTAKAAERTAYAFLSVAPNPIGVGQTATVVMWLDTLPPIYSNGTETSWLNFYVNITKPDGTIEKNGPLTSDPVASAYFTYTPEETGNYTFVFSFPGQTAIDGNHYSAAISPEVKLVVQEDQIMNYPSSALPTDYWTRPIYGTNREWYQIGGNWYGVGLTFGNGATSDGGFNQYTTAPETAHIVWTKQLQLGGIVGGDEWAYYTGLSYEGRFSPPIIMNGVLFYNLPLGNKGSGGGSVAVDIRTGEQLWYKEDMTLSLGQVFNYESPNQHGAYAYLWQTGSTYKMYDPLTGNLLLTLANASTGRITFGEQGEMLVYLLSNTWHAMWNSSYASYNYPGITGTNAWQWRPPIGTTQDWRAGIQWNVTIPDVPGSQRVAALGEGVIIGAGQSGDTTVTTAGYSMTTGEMLWTMNITSNVANRPNYFIVPIGNGVFTFFKQETMEFYAYDIDTGKLVWGPTEPYDNAWGMYTSSSGGLGASNPQIAYDTLYSVAYDGKVHAYDIETGEHLWDFSTGSAGFETAYGTYPLGSGTFAIADGKIYAATGEHSPNTPMWRGGRIYSVNATSGEGVWNLTGWWQNPAIADGYLTAFNSYDGNVYSIGKGQTSTTVSAPMTAVTAGTEMVIQGSVLDQSPGATDTPAICDEYMTQWMEYLYMQQTKPNDAYGVAVSIDAIDPNNNYVHLGDTVSDASGHYGFAWETPNIPGQYTIIATFEGSNSYYSSFAETTAIVSEPAPTATPTPTPVQPATDTYVIGMGVAIIITIAIIGAAILLTLKKRP
jgi:outer membrane protein assembly factor BamB